MKPHQSRRYRQDRTPPSDDRSWQHANFDDEPAGTQSLRQPLRSRSGGGGGSGRRQDAPRSRSQPPLIAADAPAAITSLRTSPTQRQTSPRSRQRNGGGSRSARRQRAARAAQHETRPHSPSPQPSTPPPKIDAARTVPRVVSPAPSTAVDTVRMPERESSPSSSSERRHRNAKRLVQRAASTTAATVATIKNRTQKIAKAPARAADDEDPTKMCVGKLRRFASKQCANISGFIRATSRQCRLFSAPFIRSMQPIRSKRWVASGACAIRNSLERLSPFARRRRRFVGEPRTKLKLRARSISRYANRLSSRVESSANA